MITLNLVDRVTSHIAIYFGRYKSLLAKCAVKTGS